MLDMNVSKSVVKAVCLIEIRSLLSLSLLSSLGSGGPCLPEPAAACAAIAPPPTPLLYTPCPAAVVGPTSRPPAQPRAQSAAMRLLLSPVHSSRLRRGEDTESRWGGAQRAGSRLQEADDFYALLGVPRDATAEHMKKQVCNPVPPIHVHPCTLSNYPGTSAAFQIHLIPSIRQMA